MLFDKDRDKNIFFIDEIIFHRTHIAVGHIFKGRSPTPLLNKHAVASKYGEGQEEAKKEEEEEEGEVRRQDDDNEDDGNDDDEKKRKTV